MDAQVAVFAVEEWVPDVVDLHALYRRKLLKILQVKASLTSVLGQFEWLTAQEYTRMHRCLLKRRLEPQEHRLERGQVGIALDKPGPLRFVQQHQVVVVLVFLVVDNLTLDLLKLRLNITNQRVPSLCHLNDQLTDIILHLSIMIQGPAHPLNGLTIQLQQLVLGDFCGEVVCDNGAHFGEAGAFISQLIQSLLRQLEPILKHGIIRLFQTLNQVV